MAFDQTEGGGGIKVVKPRRRIESGPIFRGAVLEQELFAPEPRGRHHQFEIASQGDGVARAKARTIVITHANLPRRFGVQIEHHRVVQVVHPIELVEPLQVWVFGQMGTRVDEVGDALELNRASTCPKLRIASASLGLPGNSSPVSAST